MASKLSPQQAGKKKSRAAMEFREKRKFFTLRPPPRKRREISGWVQWDSWALIQFGQVHFGVSQRLALRLPQSAWIGYMDIFAQIQF